MWFLEHESLFGGKRVWLRPGSQQLFGRTKPSDAGSSESKNVFIDNKNVSRKHMMIEVSAVAPGDGTKLHKRSQVEVTDLSCRQGTTIDNETHKSTKESDGTITYDKTILKGTEHTIKLSNSYPPFKIKWQDMVFTFAIKEKQDNTTSTTRSTQLHALDIKTSSEFVYGKTTHVVSQKRNLPKVLQGLVSGKPIVTTDYIDMVLKAAARSSDANDAYVPSQLEEDFDTWWPKEKECIPPVGAEPVARPEQMLEPDSTRSEVFSGLTFVFVDENQYANLNQVIGGGGGKALLYDIRLGETTAEEYVDYVNNVLGQKKRSKSNKGPLAVITIRPSSYPDEFSEWATNFILKVDRLLTQRSIQQNEFLDAIVTKDRSQLQRPAPETIDVESSMEQPPSQPLSQNRDAAPARSQISAPPQNAEASSTPEEVKLIPRKRPLRRAPTTRFTGFDDYEPPTKVRRTEDVVMEDIQEPTPVQEPSPPPAPPSQMQSQPRRSARSQNVTESVERADQMEELFPAAAAVKRQRAATRGPSASVEPELKHSVRTAKSKSKAVDIVEKLQKSKKKADKEINVREEARKRVEKDEEQRRAEEESLREALEGVDISEIRAKIQLAEMTVRSRDERPSVQNQLRSDRWDPAWNGRKNFKKFRRRGVDRGPQSQKVLVSFDEAPAKQSAGSAIFFEDATPSFARTQEEQGGSKTSKARVVEESESEPETGFTRKKRKETTKKATKTPDVIHVADSGSEDEEQPVSTRSTRGSGRVAETQLEQTQTQTQKGKKRSIVSVAAGQPSMKKSKIARMDEDSDEEETGFRFRKRG
ncbi:hypothetical protein DM02DRAFT_587974 [Periconia macrospinosa]|uniref:FHA domain-containing protein n=1 Tax=Periconia macrospinosa TaxID=97972 RepID=A0A2V1DZD4_9PLEO|nr:hypothetical protein DM02DRAFT_587974 [Periconia macrospinosa]